MLLVANGAAGGNRWPATPGRLPPRWTSLHRPGKAIAGDGEGATHLITIEISGCADRRRPGDRQDRGQQPAGEDGAARGRPELGANRLGGRATPTCRSTPSGVTLRLNGLLLYQTGAPVEFDGKAVPTSIRDNRDTLVQLEVQRRRRRRFWTADLTAEYVRLNADYHTSTGSAP